MRSSTSANGGWPRSDLRFAQAVIRFLAQRIALGALVVVFASALTFFFVNLAPGGPASVMRFDVSAEQREALIHRMGLDRPVPERYVEWLAAAVRGDLGSSLLTDEPVAQRIGERLPNTLALAGSALLLSVGAGIPIGVVQALRRGRAVDHVLSLLSAVGLAVPVFWLGIVLILVFAVSLHVLPSAGVTGVASDSLGDRLAHLVLPAVALATTILPTIVRFVRSSTIEVLDEDYIRTATSKGLSPRTVITRHALRNALIPVVSAIGALVPLLLGGRVTLLVGVAAMLAALIIGVVVGAIAGYSGGWLDAVLMRFTDAMLAVPAFFFILVVITVSGTGLATLVLVIGGLSWMPVARVVYGETLRWKTAEFVIAATSLGVPARRLLASHILPQAIPSLVVSATLGVAFAILTESALSYLGLGVQPPIPSWGNMLQRAQQYVFTAPALAIYPGLAITVVVLAFNFLGDGLRDALDPRRRR